MRCKFFEISPQVPIIEQHINFYLIYHNGRAFNKIVPIFFQIVKKVLVYKTDKI